MKHINLFQFLIGILKSTFCLRRFPYSIVFQFLIGILKSLLVLASCLLLGGGFNSL